MDTESVTMFMVMLNACFFTVPQLCRYVRGPGLCHFGHEQELIQQVK